MADKDITTTVKIDASDAIKEFRGIWTSVRLPEFLTIEDATHHSKFSSNTVRKAIVEKRLRATQPEGREYRISRADFLRWMEGDEPLPCPTDAHGFLPQAFAVEHEEGEKDGTLTFAKGVEIPTGPGLLTLLDVNWGHCPWPGYSTNDRVYLKAHDSRWGAGLVVEAPLGETFSKVVFSTWTVQKFNEYSRYIKEEK